MTKRFLLAMCNDYAPIGGFGDIWAASDDIAALKNLVAHDADRWRFFFKGRANDVTRATILDTATLTIVATWVVGFEDWINEEHPLEIVVV